MTISLQKYTGASQQQQLLGDYHLADLTYTGSPQKVVAKLAHDHDRDLILIFQADQLVGAFCLHQHAGPVRGHGYALMAMQQLPAYVRQQYPQIKRLILAVNHANLPAQHLYQRAGFQDTRWRPVGPLGVQWVLIKVL
ncbi:hypothetical protein [Lactobacillus ginsenosidimutans] [Lactiplantibacillus mudanjiangensis]|uniref:GNAT family N-acetyltransferase n=1 Tax=Lactiplantibacillus mudanjiangensis TaxID=1296538 RepID=UPI0010146487|nr:GNAT family N-acetyltransferase [Lactiplantibacillus mudanjiangensis]VDG19667.1 hypothetical protein [Lactobacillus ginsenosidimutans] [Lactiplantibacillus mudanjiangensis]VDG31111.1 hypothetical protein [Lactobacillus ginsenosidimutans] [Lactiplantibacillus mudanjiangensis]